MNYLQKKELKVIWSNLSSQIESKAITDIYFFAQHDRDSYICISFGNLTVFFIFKMEMETVELFSYKPMDKSTLEFSLKIKNKLEACIFSNKNKKKTD
jgi:hypothetical protein